jgi:hypothetical protein
VIGQIIELGLPFDGVFPKGETNTDDGEKVPRLFRTTRLNIHSSSYSLASHLLRPVAALRPSDPYLKR